MYQSMRNMLFHTIISAVLAALMLPMVSFAAETSVSVSIPVSIEVSGRKIPDIPSTVKIESVTPGAPMPETVSITKQGSGQIVFGPITYRLPADYQYRIYQNSESGSYLKYDQNIYNVKVRVVNTPEGSLAAELWAAKDGNEGQKAESIAFNNNYYRPSDGGSSGGGGTGSGSSGTPADGLTQIDETATPLAGIFPTDLITDILIPEGLIPKSMLPKTGDPTNLALCIVLIMTSGLLLLALMAYKRRMDVKGS